jgi:hypothetical protein
MKLAHWTAVLTLAALAVAPAANAADARLADCTSMAKQVAAALESAQPGQPVDAARVQANAGHNFCAMGLYPQGVAQYSKALQVLGKA